MKKITLIIGSLTDEEYRPYIENKEILIIKDIEFGLSPSQQKDKLYSLLGFCKKQKQKVVITTQSPYILNALTLAIKAYQVHLPLVIIDQWKKEYDIVPRNALVNNEDVTIYEKQTNRELKLLPNINGIPSDNNILNNALAESNHLFGELLEIQQKQ